MSCSSSSSPATANLVHPLYPADRDGIIDLLDASGEMSDFEFEELGAPMSDDDVAALLETCHRCGNHWDGNAQCACLMPSPEESEDSDCEGHFTLEPLPPGGLGNDGKAVLAEEAPVAPRSTPATQASARAKQLVRRRWMITWNNPDISDEQMVDRIAQVPAFRGAVFQRERGDGTSGVPEGTPHFQVYLECSRAISNRQLGGVLPQAHLIEATGPKERCVRYCSKEESRVSGPYTVGDMTVSQGSRSDLHKAAEMLMAGKSLQEVAKEDPTTFIHNAGGLYKFQRTLGQGDIPTYFPRNNALFYGPSRTGKSRLAREMESKAYIKTPNKWFEFYCGEDATIWDDYGSSWAIPLAQLLGLLDCYYTRVEVKGGEDHWLVKSNVFTSNTHPSTWYRWTGREAELLALSKRFDLVMVFDEFGAKTELRGEEKDSWFTTMSPGVGGVADVYVPAVDMDLAQ